MKPKSIGIIGGAGPLAGAQLFERVLSLASSSYGCYKDADFPQIFLISFPFSEMLTPDVDTTQIEQELNQCLEQLRQNGASILAIACNTLHAFLGENEKAADLIHMPRATASEISSSDLPLVLCTSTSIRAGLHKRFFPCLYPDSEVQVEIDQIINQILKGVEQQEITQRILKVINEQSSSTIILGCTELSLFTNSLQISNKMIIDPLEVVAKKLLEKSFVK